MSIVLSRRLKAFEALAKLVLADDRPRPSRSSRPSRHGFRRKPSKLSRLGLIAGLVRRLRGR